jgi:hypothetical protein
MIVDFKLIKDIKERELLRQRNKQIRFMRKMLRALKHYIKVSNISHSIPTKVWSWLEAECRKR